MTPPSNIGQIKGTSKLRFETLNAFCDFGIEQAGLTPAAAVVWLILFRHAKPDGTATVSIKNESTAFGGETPRSLSEYSPSFDVSPC